MESILQYKILSDIGFIVEYCKGKITWKDYAKMKKVEFEDADFNDSYNVIIDISEVKTKFTPSAKNEMLKYIKCLEKQKNTIEHKISVIAYTPEQLLNSEVFSMLSKKLSVKINTVCTFSYAANWGLLNKSDSYIAFNALVDLKKEI